MRLIDSHCHIDFPDFNQDREDIINQARINGVSDIIVPGITANTWPRLKAICTHFPNLHPAYGLHPYFLDKHDESHLQTLESYLQNESCIAVGECGLDFFIPDLDQKKQLHYFISQLELAKTYQLPVVIHARKSVDTVLKYLRQYPGLTGMIHSFSGSEQQAKQLIDQGFYLSFGGPITYDRAKKLRKLVTHLPLGSLLLETDAPDQPDSQHHGQRNQPDWLPLIAQCISELKNENIETVAQATSDNAKKLFRITS